METIAPADGGRPLLRIAHRGVSGRFPEHTRPAFAEAVRLGVDMIEMDVQLTRDRELVVVHDRMLGRTLPGDGAVRDHTLAELRAGDAGGWFDAAFAGETVLTFAEICEIVPPGIAFNTEIKSPEADWQDTVVRLLDTLDRYGRRAGTVISCFEIGALHAVRKVAADAAIGVLWHHPEMEMIFDAAAELGARSLHPWWPLATPEMVDRAHAMGHEVIVWTVNEADAIAELRARGVDGIISDFPERLF